MSVRKLMTSLAVVSMIAAPTMAQAAPAASSLSLSGARATASEGDESNLAGGSVVIAVLAAAAIIAGIIIAADGDDDPVSP